MFSYDCSLGYQYSVLKMIDELSSNRYKASGINLFLGGKYYLGEIGKAPIGVFLLEQFVYSYFKSYDLSNKDYGSDPPYHFSDEINQNIQAFTGIGIQLDITTHLLVGLSGGISYTYFNLKEIIKSSEDPSEVGNISNDEYVIPLPKILFTIGYHFTGSKN